MKYNITKYKDEISLIHIDNEKNLKATLVTFGAGVYELSFNGKPVILTLKNLDDYLYSSQYFGKTLGGVAGRLKKDGYIDGTEYHLTPEPGQNFALHGGMFKSISYKNWDYKIKETNKKLDVTFNITTRLNDCGYPGKLRIYVTYSFLKDKDEFKILFKATTPSEAAFINLSNHMYFNFNSSDISDHYLKMNTNKVAITEPNLLITGLKDITDELNFQKSNKLNKRLEYIEKHDFKGTIDDTFTFSELPGKITLSNKELKMDIITDCSSLNIYVDNSKSPVEFKNENIGPIRRGIALEPQRFLLNKDEIILHKGETYKNYITYKFKGRE